MIRLKEIMKAFGGQFGLSGLAADRDGVYGLDVDGMTVSVMEAAEKGKVVMWARVGDLPSEGAGAFSRQLLEAMAPDDAADGSVLSVEAESKAVYLHRMDDLATLDLDSFKAVLSKFVDRLEDWRNRLGDFRPQTDAADENMFGFLRV